jgi:hypothetical protein
MLMCIGSPRVIHATICSSETLKARAHWFVKIPLLHFRVSTVLVFAMLSPKYLHQTLNETASRGLRMIPGMWSCTIRYTRVQYNIDVVERTPKLQVRDAV